MRATSSEYWDYLTSGRGHDVFLSPDGTNVRKVPRKPSAEYSYEEHWRYIAALGGYFPGLLADTEILTDHARGYVLSQPFLEGFAGLSRANLDRPETAERFRAILAANDRMYAETGMAIDFFGEEGVASSLVAELVERAAEDDSSVVAFFAKRWVRTILDRYRAYPAKRLSNILSDRFWESLALVDPTLTDVRSPLLAKRVRSKFVNRANAFLLRRYFGEFVPADSAFARG